MQKLVLGSLLLVASLACSEPAGLAIDATGLVTGQAYFDRDADGERDQGSDPPIGGIVAAILLEETGDTIAQATTEGDGSFEIEAIPVGTYRLVGRPSELLGDSLAVVQIDSARITVTPADTIRRVLRVSYPTVPIAEARTLPAGRRVVIEGIALNGWSSFGDSTVHVADASGALRAVRTRPSGLQAGDSVRILGTLGLVNGRPTLVDGQPEIVGVARGLPAAVTLTTGAAATAAAGRHASARVRVSDATVRDTATAGGFRRVGVDDGSGRLELLLNRDLPFSSEAFLPGAIVEVTGVLAPGGSGSAWQLRPHDPAEVEASFATVSAADARALPAGQRVYVEGVALNAWNVFGDSTLHVADASGAIRAVRVRPTGVLAGDSVRILGTTGRTEGRAALLDATATVLAFGRGLPARDSVGTGVAARAAGGARANGQVRLAGALVQDTATVAGDLVLGVDDGSGRLDVVLDRSVTFGAGPWVPGSTFQGAGVLVPAQDSLTWRLKPRDRDEARITFETVTVAAARALASGSAVVIEGVALNGWSAFGDSTVHVADATGAIRATRVASSSLQAGDSVRLIGTTDRLGGQPVVTRATATILAAGVGHAPPPSVDTEDAAGASGRADDAALVAVEGTVVGEQTIGTETVFTVDDGSGPVGVLVGASVAAAVSGLAPGAELSATGVLVPAGTGTWRLRPRSAADLTVTHPTISIEEARELPAGRQAYIEGIALNSWITFGDSTVHVRDRDGDAIRVVALPSASIFAGDSVRILGTASSRNGQPVLVGAGSAVLLAGADDPNATSLTTGTADDGRGGDWDARLVRVTGPTVDSVTVTAGGDVHLRVDDGSGVVTVVLDRHVGFPSGGWAVGMSVSATGLLVASDEFGRWYVKPRAVSELVVFGGP